jgi:DNA mismatch repair ATPase MutS
MDLSPLALGASIRTLDSLLDGASRFYAEIRAIKRAVDQASGSLPGLFLLDELLHGTNSEDRRIGADAIVRAFLGRNAIGIITTHDLALAAIADGLGSRAENAHFEFALDGDEIRFDYTLHPGTVKAGNALAIMRAAGLELPQED